METYTARYAPTCAHVRCDRAGTHRRRGVPVCLGHLLVAIQRAA